MKRCPEELKKKLDDEFPTFDYLDNPILEQKRFKLIYAYWDKHCSTMCQWEGCKKKSHGYAVNLAGDLVYNYCKEHLDKHNQHVKHFSII